MKRLAALAFALSLPGGVAAQPMGDEDLRVEDEAIVVARFAAPDERVGPLAARRLSSRARAESRGRAAIHDFVDDAMDRVMAQPDVASRVHERVAGDEVAVRVRPLVDASSVVELSLPLGALRAVAPLEGVPW
ncbi:MAG: hypothetical protein JJ863_22085 [Deltaproteobacteria bacterium]|nr:hypothetical protein [Deltaproteobacteria bacterium]